MTARARVTSESGGQGADRTVRARADRARGVLYALLSALLFGGSTPFVRALLARADPIAGAGYLYLGQAVVLSAWWLAARASGRRKEASLGREDLAPLLAGIVAGGLIAPGAFTAGLALLPAHRASLLLGLEIAFTLMIAIAFRGERLPPRGSEAHAKERKPSAGARRSRIRGWRAHPGRSARRSDGPRSGGRLDRQDDRRARGLPDRRRHRPQAGPRRARSGRGPGHRWPLWHR